ncbi:hypothetical protein DFH08DRAFT_517654 [Mycena albidolilacea]|uniref:Uncharacterized protein n=1 Tax=Mycena albidolilacea TaxID=1033008 RepID=A0AAD6Z4E6_9AGAR|nr:hypothetical protein DFH08DRAFT_517654 [Mycena albidolilacea]
MSHRAIRRSQSTEFRVDSVVDSDFDSGPLRSPASSRSRSLLGPRIEIIDSGVDSDVVPPEEEQRFCFDSRSILISESVQNRFQNRLRLDTESTTLTSPIGIAGDAGRISSPLPASPDMHELRVRTSWSEDARRSQYSRNRDGLHGAAYAPLKDAKAEAGYFDSESTTRQLGPLPLSTTLALGCRLNARPRRSAPASTSGMPPLLHTLHMSAAPRITLVPRSPSSPHLTHGGRSGYSCIPA